VRLRTAAVTPALFAAAILSAAHSRATAPVPTASVDAGTTAAGSGPPSAKPLPRDLEAEVEISGSLQISKRPARLFAFLSKSACDPKRIESELIGAVQIDPYVSRNFFIEVFVPQGSTGNICGAALDEKGNIIAFGSFGKNPLTFKGKGEVTFGNVLIPLKPLLKPVPAPKKFKS
jgi:hypothetical protein